MTGPRYAELHEIRGFRVVVDNSRPDIATDDVLERLDEAIVLLDRYQPWRMRHLRRDLAQFLVVRYPCRGAYLPAERTIVTELTFLARRDISAAPVASSILHEGVHARVDRMRLRLGLAGGAHDAAREERLCRRTELAFGRVLPAELGAPVVERALASLALEDAERIQNCRVRQIRVRQSFQHLGRARRSLPPDDVHKPEFGIRQGR